MAMPPVQRGYSPSVRARRLARILKKAREDAGFNQGTVADTLSWSQPKVAMIEKARRRASPRDVERLLDMYGIHDDAQRAVILDLAHSTEQRSWWTEYADLLEGPYLALEDEAARIRVWSPHLIPGILQTPAYARSLFEADVPNDPAEVERRLQARMLRQGILSRADAPEIHVVLDQTVLERRVGGQAAFAEQMERLAADARRENMLIQVMPRSVAVHPGIDGALIMLQMPDEGDPDVGYCEGHFGAVYLENPQQVNRCNLAFEEISEAALRSEDSVALIEAAVTTAR